MDARRQAVVVGIDGSADANRALAWAAAEAGLRGVPLRVVNAFGWPDEHGAHDRPAIGRSYRAELLHRAHEVTAAAAAQAREIDAGLVVEHKVAVGFPIGVLAAEAHRAQLLVVGDRGISRLQGMLLGSVSVALATHASCPVVVVRGVLESDREGQGRLPVIVGVDGSPLSEAPLAFAFDAAAARKVPLVAVHTWSDLGVDPAMALPVAEADIDADWAAEALAERLAGWAEKYPDVPVERVVERDSAAAVLLRQSARAQLVVVGSRGHGEFAGLVLGSVSNALVHRAACPVAVARMLTGEKV